MTATGEKTNEGRINWPEQNKLRTEQSEQTKSLQISRHSGGKGWQKATVPGLLNDQERLHQENSVRMEF